MVIDWLTSHKYPTLVTSMDGIVDQLSLASSIVVIITSMEKIIFNRQITNTEG